MKSMYALKVHVHSYSREFISNSNVHVKAQNSKNVYLTSVAKKRKHIYTIANLERIHFLLFFVFLPSTSQASVLKSIYTS